VIGTTDLDNGGIDNNEARMSQVELNYLLELLAYYFPKLALDKSKILASFAGVRPLIASGARNPSKEKRNHSIWQEQGLISVSGGKLTTFRLIALDVLAVAQNRLKNWPKNRHFDQQIFKPVTDIPAVLAQIPAATQRRLLGYYGTNLPDLLAKAQEGELSFIADTPFLWCELRYSAAYEAVQHLDDLLLRRTRLGLILTAGGEALREKIQPICMQELAWSVEQFQKEWLRYQGIVQQYYSA
jgi:glycerol-3-phosphate dehydrogenase